MEEWRRKMLAANAENRELIDSLPSQHLSTGHYEQNEMTIEEERTNFELNSEKHHTDENKRRGLRVVHLTRDLINRIRKTRSVLNEFFSELIDFVLSLLVDVDDLDKSYLPDSKLIQTALMSIKSFARTDLERKKKRPLDYLNERKIFHEITLIIPQTFHWEFETFLSSREVNNEKKDTLVIVQPGFRINCNFYKRKQITSDLLRIAEINQVHQILLCGDYRSKLQLRFLQLNLISLLDKRSDLNIQSKNIISIMFSTYLPCLNENTWPSQSKMEGMKLIPFPRLEFEMHYLDKMETDPSFVESKDTSFEESSTKPSFVESAKEPSFCPSSVEPPKFSKKWKSQKSVLSAFEKVSRFSEVLIDKTHTKNYAEAFCTCGFSLCERIAEPLDEKPQPVFFCVTCLNDPLVTQALFHPKCSEKHHVQEKENHIIVDLPWDYFPDDKITAWRNLLKYPHSSFVLTYLRPKKPEKLTQTKQNELFLIETSSYANNLKTKLFKMSIFEFLASLDRPFIGTVRLACVIFAITDNVYITSLSLPQPTEEKRREPPIDIRGRLASKRVHLTRFSPILELFKRFSRNSPNRLQTILNRFQTIPVPSSNQIITLGIVGIFLNQSLLHALCVSIYLGFTCFRLPHFHEEKKTIDETKAEIIVDAWCLLEIPPFVESITDLDENVVMKCFRTKLCTLKNSNIWSGNIEKLGANVWWKRDYDSDNETLEDSDSDSGLYGSDSEDQCETITPSDKKHGVRKLENARDILLTYCREPTKLPQAVIDLVATKVKPDRKQIEQKIFEIVEDILINNV